MANTGRNASTANAVRDENHIKQRCGYKKQFTDLAGNKRLKQCDLVATTRNHGHPACVNHEKFPEGDFTKGEPEPAKGEERPIALDTCTDKRITGAAHERADMVNLSIDQYIHKVVSRSIKRFATLYAMPPPVRYLIEFRVPIAYIAAQCCVSKATAMTWSSGGRNNKKPASRYFPILHKILRVVYAKAHQECVILQRGIRTTKEEGMAVVKVSTLLLEVKDYLERVDSAGGRV